MSRRTHPTYRTQYSHEEGSALQPSRIARGEWLRFLRKTVVDDEGHWLWQGSVDWGGYGHYAWHGFVYPAHRFAYIALRGPIAGRFELDHLCCIRHCVNPNHLDLVTHHINILRGRGAQRGGTRLVSCKRGHPFNDDNTLVRRKRYADGTVGRNRRCRICTEQYRREAWALVLLRRRAPEELVERLTTKEML